MLLKASVRLLALAAVVLVASPVSAAPARVKVFEAQARSGAKDTARILHQFPENSEISVSEDADEGWRRVRLPDGKTGYIKDSQIELISRPKGAETTPAPKRPAEEDEDDEEDDPPAKTAPKPAPKPAAAPVRDGERPRSVAAQAKDDDAPKAPRAPSARPSDAETRSRAVGREALAIDGLSQLAELTKEDPVVGGDIERLLRRRNIGLGVGIGGGVVGLGILVGGFTFLAERACTVCESSPNWVAIGVGGAMAAISGALTWFMWPGRTELSESVETWNRRHPESPLELTP